MTTYNTAYKSGTLNGAPGAGSTTFTVAGFTPASGDVGRIIIITSGNARLQHREITGVSGQDITVAHPWDTNNFIDTSSDGRATDVLPSGGDACVISYNADDLISSDADLTLTDVNHLKIDAIRVETGAYIHFKDYHIEWDYSSVLIGSGAGLILGYYGFVQGEDGYTKNACHITEIATTAALGIAIDITDSMGMLDIYGGSVYCESGTPIWRAYENAADSRDVQVRWVDFTAYGNFGAGTDGDRSMFIRCTAVNGATILGFLYPRSAVARVEISALNCDQAGFVFIDSVNGGPSGRLSFPRIVDIKDKVIRSFGSSAHTGNNVLEVIAKKSEIDSAPTFIESDGAPASGTHIYRYGNLVRPTFIDSTGATVTDNIKNRLYDTNSTFIEEETVTNGAYPEVFVRHTDIATVAGDLNLSDGTQYAPYSLRSVSYGKQFANSSISVEDTFEPNIVLLNDGLITQSTKSVVDAYSELESPEKFYDRAVSWLEANITSETDFLVSRSGSTIDAGSYNVTIDATAGSVFAFDGSTITIKASTFTGNITTTGAFTLTNGAVGVGTFISSAGTQTSISLTFNNLTNSFVEIFDNTGASVQRYTNQTGSLVYITPLGSTGTWSYIVDRPGYRPIKSTFDPTISNLIIDGTQNQLLTAQGNPMYTGSTSSFVTVTYDFVTPQLSIEIGDSAVSPQVIIDEVELSLVTADGIRWQKENNTLVTFDDLPGAGPILFLQDNIRLKRATAGDVNSAVNGYVLSSEGVAVDGVNGNVNYIASPDYATPVWGALLSSHNVSSSFGELIQALDTKTNIKPSVSI